MKFVFTKKKLDQSSKYLEFGKYLQRNIDMGIIDFSMRATLQNDGSITFYIHPAHVSGNTVDYTIANDSMMVMNTPNLDRLVDMVDRYINKGVEK